MSEDLLRIGLTLAERREPDIVNLLSKAANYDYILLLEAADEAKAVAHESVRVLKSETWHRLSIELENAAVESLRHGVRAPAANYFQAKTPRFPDVVVNVYEAVSDASVPFEGPLERLVAHVSRALKLHDHSAARAFRDDLEQRIRQRPPTPMELMKFIGSYVTLDLTKRYEQ